MASQIVKAKRFYCKEENCPKKLLGFNNRANLRRHHKEVHETAHLQCRHCQQTFGRKARLVKHQKFAHEDHNGAPCQVATASSDMTIDEPTSGEYEVTDDGAAASARMPAAVNSRASCGARTSVMTPADANARVLPDDNAAASTRMPADVNHQYSYEIQEVPNKKSILQYRSPLAKETTEAEYEKAIATARAQTRNLNKVLTNCSRRATDLEVEKGKLEIQLSEQEEKLKFQRTEFHRQLQDETRRRCKAEHELSDARRINRDLQTKISNLQATVKELTMAKEAAEAIVLGFPSMPFATRTPFSTSVTSQPATTDKTMTAKTPTTIPTSTLTTEEDMLIISEAESTLSASDDDLSAGTALLENWLAEIATSRIFQ